MKDTYLPYSRTSVASFYTPVKAFSTTSWYLLTWIYVWSPAQEYTWSYLNWHSEIQQFSALSKNTHSVKHTAMTQAMSTSHLVRRMSCCSCLQAHIIHVSKIVKGPFAVKPYVHFIQIYHFIRANERAFFFLLMLFVIFRYNDYFLSNSWHKEEFPSSPSIVVGANPKLLYFYFCTSTLFPLLFPISLQELQLLISYETTTKKKHILSFIRRCQLKTPK